MNPTTSRIFVLIFKLVTNLQKLGFEVPCLLEIVPHLPLGIKVGGEDQLQWVLLRNSLYNVQGCGCGCLIFFLLISFQKDHGDRNFFSSYPHRT